MTPSLEQHYIQLATGHPGMLCSQAPLEVLEACAADSEPTRFLVEFFTAGYCRWLQENRPEAGAPDRFQVNNAVIVLWLRACRLRTALLLGTPDPDLDKPFFSDEGLY
jgi:hypothetical protein